MSKTRVVSYRYEGDIDVETAMSTLERAKQLGIVTEFDSNKSMERGKDCVWFNGRPGHRLRLVRKQIELLVAPR